MLWSAFWLQVLFVGGAQPAHGATRIRTTLDDVPPAVATLEGAGRAPRRIRGSLDDAVLAATGRSSSAPPRRIRDSLDEPGPVEERVAAAPASARDDAHGSFPPDDGATTIPNARLIRLTLVDGASAYGFLDARPEASRRLRLTLD